MQPSDVQVELSMAALLRGQVEPRGTCRSVIVEVSPDVSQRIAEVPPVRPDRVAAARARLEGGDVPSAEEVAGKLVGRLVCDRLR